MGDDPFVIVGPRRENELSAKPERRKAAAKSFVGIIVERHARAELQRMRTDANGRRSDVHAQ
jgi:hypothetical protein